LDKRRLTSGLARYLVNPFVRTAVQLGVLRSWAVVETTGRTSGEPRRTPVGNGLDGDVFWIVAEHGQKAGYVRNIAKSPRVRICVGGRWRSGTAQLLPEDDARERQRLIGKKLNAALVRVMGTDLLTVRVDLEPVAGEPATRT
jgi:deazaflavin-dependent oxidoreductase (nitroreductase family)